MLYPEFEDNQEWFGFVKVTYFLINPLLLKHPTNTMTEEDYPLFPFESQENDFHRAVAAGFDPDVLQVFTEAVDNSAELLGLEPQYHYNYWFVGLGVRGVYREGETAEECFNRLVEENPALNFTADVIRTGELANGIRAGFKDRIKKAQEEGDIDEDVSIPFTDSNQTENPAAMLAALEHLKHAHVGVYTAHADKLCEFGLKHTCKRGSERTPTERGALTPREKFVPTINEWRTMEYIESPQNEKIKLDPQIINNYQSLVMRFAGKDVYSLRPYFTNTGEIILEWRNGPYQSGQVKIGKDNNMQIRLLDTSQEKSPADMFTKSKPPREFSVSLDFDSEKLSQYMTEGRFPL